MRMYQAAPANVRNALRITSGYRSEDVQRGLWEAALAKYGDPEIADNWVARPGTSNHNRGGAVDLKYLDPAAQEWVHANAASFGLHFPMAHEPWHIEMIDGQAVRVPDAPNALSGGSTYQRAQEAPQRPALRLQSLALDPAAFMAPVNTLRGA